MLSLALIFAISRKKLVMTAVNTATTATEYIDKMTVSIRPAADTADMSPNPIVDDTAKQYHKLSGKLLILGSTNYSIIATMTKYIRNTR